MRQIKLTREEKEIETSLLKGEYIDVSKNEFDEIARAVSAEFFCEFDLKPVA